MSIVVRHRAASAIGLALLVAAGACGRSRASDAARGARGDDASEPAAAAAVDSPAAPRPAAAIELHPADELRRVADALARGTTTTRSVGSAPTYRLIAARRAASGVPEVHDRWIDVTVVQAGRATLLAGGRVEGGSAESPGEHRGGRIVGGTPRVIGAGDLFVVPAGTPHQFQLARGDTIRYLTIKVPAR